MVSRVSTERMRIRKMRFGKKEIAKTLFGVPRATYDLKRERLKLFMELSWVFGRISTPYFCDMYY